MKPHPLGVRLFLFMAIRVQYLSMKNEYVCVSLRRRYRWLMKTLSLGDEDVII